LFAHHIVEYAGHDRLEWTEVPEPDPDAGVVVEVAAAGVSFADLLQTRGEYQLKPPLPYSPGMDAAGVVRSAPPGSAFTEGQRVAVLVRYGCWKDVIAVPEAGVLPLPDDMSFDAGAASALNHVTALFALTYRGRAEVGETLVVHGASGGVGTAAIQVGKALGLRTIAVVGDDSRRAVATDAGADEVVLADTWLEQVGRGAVDIVFDPVGGDRFTDTLRSLRVDGRVLVVGFAAGDIPSVRVSRLLLGNIDVLGAASMEYFEQRPRALPELWLQLLELRATGDLADPPMHPFAFDDARGALDAIAHRRAMGKVILTKSAFG
jgi:NADPH2:quinone reductase